MFVITKPKVEGYEVTINRSVCDIYKTGIFFVCFEISGLFKFFGISGFRNFGDFSRISGIPIPTLIHTLPELAFEVREPEANNPATPEAICSELWYKSEAV